jgi:hypothetical protein
MAIACFARRHASLAKFATFVGLVHLACMAIDHMDALAMASAMGITALEPPLGFAHVVHRADGQHGLTHAFI